MTFIFAEDYLMKREERTLSCQHRARGSLLGVLGAAIGFLASPVTLADGTETLGPPSITIAGGTGIVAKGTGLITQPGLIELDVPGAVQQALLYWECQMIGDVPADDTIIVNGVEVTGALIGGQTNFFENVYSSTRRADITALGLVASGSNALTVEGMECTNRNNGAGVMVVYDDGSDSTDIQIRDGNDLAFIYFTPPLDSTAPQTFTFDAASMDRTATLSMFFSSVSVEGEPRPSSITITVNGTTTTICCNEALRSNDGPEWDTLIIDVDIPAGATMLTVEAKSEDLQNTGNLPASFAWNAAGLSVPVEPPMGGYGCTPGYWKQDQHLDSWVGYAPGDDYETVFGIDASFSKTLLMTLGQGGGGEKALGRHAVAALLNAANPDVSFAYTEAEVIAAVQGADATGDFNGVKNQLEYQNELGCPLN